MKDLKKFLPFHLFNSKQYYSKKMPLYYLTAYRGTGKDTLVKELGKLSNEKTNPSVSSIDLMLSKYNVYSSAGKNLNIDLDLSLGIKRVSLADKLKLMVLLDLGCDKFSAEEILSSGYFEENKNVTFEKLSNQKLSDSLAKEAKELSLEENSLRDKCIRMSLELKEKHGNMYFVDLVSKDIQKYLSKNMNVFVTDNRYPYEILPNSYSIRIFRSEVEIPPENEQSERSMDDYSCDFVLSSDKDFQILKTFQPQYRDYINKGYFINYCNFVDSCDDFK